MLTLYHAWASMPAQRIRLALAYKGVPHAAIPLGAFEDELFFEMGVARSDLLLVQDGALIEREPWAALENMDRIAGGPPLFPPALDAAAWTALKAWRTSVEHVLARLTAPVLPAFAGIGDDPASLAACRAEVERRFGMGLEALSNDRYDGFRQFAQRSRLPELARHLAQNRFYIGGVLTAADLVIACDCFPLQLLDGVTLPMDLIYYIARVEDTCHASLRDGLIVQL